MTTLAPPPTTLTWATGLWSSRRIDLAGAEIVLTDRTLGRETVHRIEAEKIDPTPIPHQRTNRFLMGLVVFSLVIAVANLIDWTSRSLVTGRRELLVAAAWSALTFALALHYLRACGRFLAWNWKVSRRPAIEIPARLAERMDIAAFLRIPTLPPHHEPVAAGTAKDRLQQLDDLLKKGHISDEEYRLLKQRTLEEHRRAF